MEPDQNTRASRRRRRWPWIVGGAGVLLLLLIALLPVIASSAIGRSIATSSINSRIKGSVGIDALSLSWWGPVELRGLRLLDEQNRVVLTVERVKLEKGLAALAADAMDFGKVEVAKPQVALYLDEDGNASIASALESRKPQAPGKPGERREPPKPRGSIVLRDASVWVYPPGAKAVEWTAPHAQIALNTLDDISAELEMVLSPGQTVSASAAVKHLVHEQKLSLQRAAGVVTVTTTDAVELGPVLALAGVRGVWGVGRLHASARLHEGNVTGDILAAVRQLAAPREGQPPAPIDVRLEGKAQTSGSRTVAELTLAGPGSIKAAVEYTPGEVSMPAGDVLSAVLAGADVNMPGLSVTVSGTADLPAIAAAVPALLPLRGDTRLVGGALAMDNLSLTGGQEPAVKGAVHASGLAIERDGARQDLAALSLVCDASIRKGVGLEVRKADITAPFAGLRISGTPADMTGAFNADLDKLTNWIGQWCSSSPDIGGKVTGTVRLAGTSEGRIDTTLSMSVEQLGAASSTGRIERALLYQQGFVRLDENRVQQLGVVTAKMEIDGELLATASASYAPPAEALQAQIDITKADIARLGARAKAMGAGGLDRYAGNFTASLKISGSGGVMTASGTCRASDLKADGKPVGSGVVEIDFAGAEVGPDAVAVGSAALRSSFATAEVRELRLARRGASLSGNYAMGGDLAGILSAAGPLAGWQKPPALAGRISGSGQFSSTGQSVLVDGWAGSQDFKVLSTTGGYQDSVTLTYRALLDTRENRLSIMPVSLKSNTLSLSVTGTVTDYTGNRLLDLRVQYSGDWERITTLLHEFSPATAQTVAFSGLSSDEFVVKGAARQPRVTPVYRGVGAKPSLKWNGAQLYGLDIAAATYPLELRNGAVLLPSEPLAANGGKIVAPGVLDLTGKEPVLRIGGTVQVLSGVGLSNKFGVHVLSRANPMLAGMIDGRVSLVTHDIVLPLGDGIKTGGSGSGRLDMRDLQFQAFGPLGEVLKAVGLRPDLRHVVRPTTMDFTIENGGVRYQNFTLLLAETIDMRFSGRVGFDDSLQMKVSLPIVPNLLERFGVKGPIGDIARVLTGTRIEIPLVGSRTNFRLDFASVDIRPIVQGAAKSLMLDQPGKVLEDLLK
jgi:hypothetical protein